MKGFIQLRDRDDFRELPPNGFISSHLITNQFNESTYGDWNNRGQGHAMEWSNGALAPGVSALIGSGTGQIFCLTRFCARFTLKQAFLYNVCFRHQIPPHGPDRRYQQQETGRRSYSLKHFMEIFEALRESVRKKQPENIKTHPESTIFL